MRPNAWRSVASALSLVAAFAVVATAQTTTATKTQNFEVLSVNGNQVVARLSDGTTKEYTIPDTFRFQVQGREVSVHELKPGMTGSATWTTITKTEPVYVTEVREAEVFEATGGSLIVKGPNGFRMFTDADVAKYKMNLMKNGQPARLSDFRKGDRLTATIITSKPQTLTEQQVTARLNAAATAAGGGAAGAGGATGAARTPATRPAPSPATGGAATAPPSTGAATGTGTGATRKLPKTAGALPLAGLVGLGLMGVGASLTLVRRRRRE